MSEHRLINWSWLSGVIAGAVFVVTSAIGYGALKSDVSHVLNDMNEMKSEVKELRRSFVEFLSNQPKRTAQHQ
jgi:hypothetical protein